MNWWCSATGQSWTGTWQAYPGVWVFVAVLGAWYYVVCCRTTSTGSAGGLRVATATSRDLAWYATGLLQIWIALDWPLGALGAGYLATAHTGTYILLSISAPPCLILGVPGTVIGRALEGPVGRPLRAAAQPAPALVLYAAVLFATHVPGVVDGLMSSQAGAFAIDMAWLSAGLALWWPVLAPRPAAGRLGRPLKLAYLFASTLPAIIPSAFLTFADYPLYATYELAPRVHRLLTAQEDQKIAGLLMKVVGDLPIWFAFGVIFFRWAREGEQRPPPVHPGG